MKATLVSIRPTDAAEAAGRPGLTPELAAATGARYSRNNEGLEAILALIDPNDQDRSVDSIFRMVDYGHQSIADMAHVTIFMDGLSMWLVYYLWTLCPTASGQESSTRYIKIDPSALPSAEFLGIPDSLRSAWQQQNSDLFEAYTRALELWTKLAEGNPQLAKIPAALLADKSDKALRTVARLKRNFAFDRARYFLPLAAKTNVVLEMAARNWTYLVQHLLSHPLPEAQQLGLLINGELALITPRMLKHSVAKSSTRDGIHQELQNLALEALINDDRYLSDNNLSSFFDHPVNARLDTMAPSGVSPTAFAEDLKYHEDRYAWIGHQLRRIAVRFGWEAAALAEVRDLNRHRTGNKHCPLRPVGFYCADNQLPSKAGNAKNLLSELAQLGRAASKRALEELKKPEATYVYFLTLGTQVPYEHLTTADKFCYQAELRTGLGAHFRYAAHMRDVLRLWYERYPDTKGLILEGSAEPE